MHVHTSWRARKARAFKKAVREGLVLYVSEPMNKDDTEARRLVSDFNASVTVKIAETSHATPQLDAREYSGTIYHGLTAIRKFLERQRRKRLH